MTYNEARSKFIGKYFRYSHLYEDENFLLKYLYTKDLPKHRLKGTTDYYRGLLSKRLNIPPIFIMCGYKLRSGMIQPFHYGITIMDGNHRLGATRELGIETIPVILSESQYELFKYMRGT